MFQYRASSSTSSSNNQIHNKMKSTSQAKQINAIIIHCSRSKPSKCFNYNEMQYIKDENSIPTSQYHYIITQNGKVVYGRPEIEASYPNINNDRGSIQIQYIGGRNETTGEPDDTRTERQKYAMQLLILNICTRHSITDILAHDWYYPEDCTCYKIVRDYFDLLP